MSTPQEGRVDLEVRAGVARLTLAAPERGNAMDPAWGAAFGAAVAELEGRDDVRVVLLRAEGRAFCVGGDVRHFASAEDPGAALRDLAGDLHAAMLALAALDAPVVAAVQGAAAGAGMSLVLAADIALAARAAHFAVAYAGVGLSADGGSSWWLPRLVGHRRAAELMLTNRRVGAEEAAAIGLVTEVVDDDALAARADALCAQLAQGPTGAYGAMRRLLRASSQAGYEEQLAAEAEAIATRAASPEGREGLAAFVERRAPRFPGAPSPS